MDELDWDSEEAWENVCDSFGLDHEWAEVLADGVAHGLDFDIVLWQAQTLADYGMDSDDADNVWDIQIMEGCDLEEAIAMYVEYLEEVGHARELF